MQSSDFVRPAKWLLHCTTQQVKRIISFVLSVLALALFVTHPVAFGQRLSFGAVGGTSITRDFRTLRYTFPGEYSETTESGSRSLIIGPMAELGLTGN